MDFDESNGFNHGCVPLLRVSLNGDEKSNAVLFRVEPWWTLMVLQKASFTDICVVVLARSRPGVFPFTCIDSWKVLRAGGVSGEDFTELARFGLFWFGVTQAAVCEPSSLVSVIFICAWTPLRSIAYDGEDGDVRTEVTLSSISADSQLSGRLLDFFTALVLLVFG